MIHFNLGSWARSTSTTNHDSQKWFDQGLIWMYAFNHEGAVDCFLEALQLDPDFALACWGVAFASGPNYNNLDPTPENCKIAREYAAKALSLQSCANPAEQALIEAVQIRCMADVPKEASVAFSEKMRRVYEQYSDDADVAAVFVESLMNIRPWKLWTDGEPSPETPEILQVLKASLELCPLHPGLLHMYIHAMEMSPNPIDALPVGNLLRGLAPDAGHLWHMPSHIDVLVGHYSDAIAANVAAVEADRKYLQHFGSNNFYTLYRMHDYHMLVYAAMFCGDKATATNTANEAVANLPVELVSRIGDWVEAFAAMPWHVKVRFGEWNAIIEEPLPAHPELFLFTTAVAHYAKAVAYSAVLRCEEAVQEKERFEAAAAKVPESRTLFNNKCIDILDIARAMCEGEIAFRQDKPELAYECLRKGVKLDDSLPYDEPWGWMQPVRHALGALLLERGHSEEARVVYLDDLVKHPNNVWSLSGLQECGNSELERSQAAQQLQQAQQKADVPVVYSCYCRKK